MDDQSVVTIGFLRESLNVIIAGHRKLSLRIRALEAQLEPQPGDPAEIAKTLALFDTAFPWEPGTLYCKSAAVIHDGAMFTSNFDSNRLEPGYGGAWTKLRVPLNEAAQ